jgi:energy-converting hydrogenase Eha subunit H
MKSGRRRRDVAGVMIQGVDNIGMVKDLNWLFLLSGAWVKGPAAVRFASLGTFGSTGLDFNSSGSCSPSHRSR